MTDVLELPVDTRRPGSVIVSVGGISAAICGGGLVLSALVDVFDGAQDALALATVGFFALGIGAMMTRNSRVPDRVPPRVALRTVAVSLLTMIAVSAVAYFATGAIPRFDDALIESTAGFTTTALTVVPDPESLGMGVLFWRALSQWIGGFAAISSVIAVLPFLGVGGPAPTRAKAPTGPKHLFSPHVRRLLRQYLNLYVMLTGVGAGLFLIGGMSVFDSVTYAFSTISTGGFANHAGSFSHFDSALLEWMGVAGMFLGGLSLAIVWCLLRGRRDVLLSSREFFAYCGLIVGTTTLIATVQAPGDGFAETIRFSAFTATSAVSTTGHWAVDWSTWGPGPQLLIVIVAGIGAMSGSTGGGFRIVRAMVMFSFLRREIATQLRPRSVRAIRVGHEIVDEKIMGRMLGYQVLFLGTAAMGMVALTFSGADLVTAISGSVSALSTFGPALGELDVGQAITGLNHEALFVVGILMFAGRVELYPVLDGIVDLVTVPAARLRSLIRRGRTS